MRSSWFAKSNAYRPLLHRKSPFMPLLSRLSPRTISAPSVVERTPRVVLHPSPQCVHTVPHGSSPTAVSCSDTFHSSARPPDTHRCTCRTARNPHAGGGPGSPPRASSAQSRSSCRDSECPAQTHPSPRRTSARSDSTECSAAGRSTPPATTSAPRDGSSALHRSCPPRRT